MSAEPKAKPYSLLPPSDRMTPDEALEWAKRRGMKRVMIIGESDDNADVLIAVENGPDGPRILRRDESCYLLETTKLTIMGVYG